MTDDEIDHEVEVYRSFATAYPTDVFLPLTDEQRRDHGQVITRASAAMGRQLARYFHEAADTILHLQAELRKTEEALRNAEEQLETERQIGGEWCLQIVDLQCRLNAAQTESIHEMFKVLQSAEVEGLSHESGWTLMATTTAEALRDRAEALQARGDALMLEHCPDEMTSEQREEWARNQRAVR